MKDLLPTISNWIISGQRIVLARVVKTWGSSPRAAGSCMVISDKLEMAGSVSGGCVEGAVLKEAKKIFEGDPAKTLAYGVTDDEAWTVGLSCGGKIDVFIQPWFEKEISMLMTELLTTNTSFSLITNSKNNSNAIVQDRTKIIGAEVGKDLMGIANTALDERIPFSVEHVEGVDYLIHAFPRRSRMIIIGAAHVTADLVALARQFDFETIVIDPRGVFAQRTTFNQQPDQIIEKYPSEVLPDLSIDSHTYAVVLSHDPKIDDDALKVLLRSKAAYMGALGSKKNHEKRMHRLLEAGFTADELKKINAPIGIDINAIGTKEIALSIMGAIIQTRNANLR